jgi:hypothetical protein
MPGQLSTEFLRQLPRPTRTLTWAQFALAIAEFAGFSPADRLLVGDSWLGARGLFFKVLASFMET